VFIDLKMDIRQALLSNAVLFSLLNGPHVYPIASPDASLRTYITIQEIGNFDKDHANDQALSNGIHFQIDVWTPFNTGPFVQEVDKTMKSLGFGRSGAQDGYGRDTSTYRKILRYKTTKFGG